MRDSLKSAVVALIVLSISLGFFLGLGIMSYVKDTHKESDTLAFAGVALVCVTNAIGVIILFLALFSRKAKLNSENKISE